MRPNNIQETRVLKDLSGRGSRVTDCPAMLKPSPDDISTSSFQVAILLCTYNGQQYLAEQLDSFSEQTYTKWKVWASDDGSIDQTCTILNNYRKKWSPGKLSIHVGPARGFAANFLALACKASIAAEYYAYSDQDDIWELDKLERAVRWLETIPKHLPALYCSRTRIVNAQGHEIGLSPLYSRPPTFAGALMQNIGGGNTMVFNNAARCLLQQAGEDISIVTHDWWTYMVVLGAGGRVFYDPYPSLRYRQHGNNLIGANSNWRARLIRARMQWQGCFRGWNDVNVAALRTVLEGLTPENREILERFSIARQLGLVRRIVNLNKCGIRRQTLLGNLGLAVAAVFKKI